MLEGQLGLTTHRETRTSPPYALVLRHTDGRLGPSLKPSTIDCFAGGANPRPNADPATVGPYCASGSRLAVSAASTTHFFGLSGARVTMAELAREFHRQQYPLSPDREVVDRTGLTGAYDFELRFGAPAARRDWPRELPRRQEYSSRSGSARCFTALPEQLGLKLVDTTVSREVLVIDQINRP